MLVVTCPLSLYFFVSRFLRFGKSSKDPVEEEKTDGTPIYTSSSSSLFQFSVLRRRMQYIGILFFCVSSWINLNDHIVSKSSFVSSFLFKISLKSRNEYKTRICIHFFHQYRLISFLNWSDRFICLKWVYVGVNKNASESYFNGINFRGD